MLTGTSQLPRPRRVRIACVLAGSLCLASIVACEYPTDPPWPAGAVRMDAPGVYATWWRMTESCSGRQGNLAAVRWYYVPGTSEISVEGEHYDGFWFGTSNSVILADESRFSGSLVRHEMLHALAGETHAGPFFADLCQGIVACVEECAAEAATPPAPDASSPNLPVSALDLELTLNPANVSVASDGGWVAIVISARNPRSTAVWVPLTPVGPGSHFASTFGYVVQCAGECKSGSGSSYYYIQPPRLGMSAGGVQRGVFDEQFLPGIYSIRGTFNLDTTAAVTLTVRP